VRSLVVLITTSSIPASDNCCNIRHEAGGLGLRLLVQNRPAFEAIRNSTSLALFKSPKAKTNRKWVNNFVIDSYRNGKRALIGADTARFWKLN
jgi:hypothetical protein